MMSMTFTKLFSSITESTVWCEDAPTRIVWITMLAMADRKGRVWASVPGLANRARVSTDECRRALTKFLSPDPDSRTKDHEGRRIHEIDGGWLLLNHGKYRAIRDAEERRAYKTAKQREYRASVDNVDNCGPQKTAVDSNGHNAEAEAEAYTERERRASRFAPKGFQPTREMHGWAKELGFSKADILLETDKFRDYERPRPIKDWNRAWRNWMRKAKEFRPAEQPTKQTEAERLGLVQGENETDEQFQKRLSDALVRERYG